MHCFQGIFCNKLKRQSLHEMSEIINRNKTKKGVILKKKLKGTSTLSRIQMKSTRGKTMDAGETLQLDFYSFSAFTLSIHFPSGKNSTLHGILN